MNKTKKILMVAGLAAGAAALPNIIAKIEDKNTTENETKGLIKSLLSVKNNLHSFNKQFKKAIPAFTDVSRDIEDTKNKLEPMIIKLQDQLKKK